MGEQFNLKGLKINNFYKKYNIVDVECPYTLEIREYNGQPLITLVKLNIIQLISNNTLTIKIPDIVEALDTQRWMDYYSHKEVLYKIYKIVLIGNNKPLYGNLIGAFSFLQEPPARKFTKKEQINSYKPEYMLITSIESIEIRRFDGSNIRDIQYIFNQITRYCKIDIAQLNLQKIHKADNIQINGNILGRLLEQGIRFENIRSLGGFGGQIGKWRKKNIIDTRSLNVYKINNLDNSFYNCCNLVDIIGLDNRLDDTVQCENTFAYCNKLVKIPESIKNAKIVSQKHMFYKSGIRQINSLNLKETKNMRGMFSMCHNLREVKIDGNGEQFNVIEASELFFGSSNIEMIHIKNIKLTSINSLQQSFQFLQNLKIAIFENIEITQDDTLDLYELLQGNDILEKVIFKNIHIACPIQIVKAFYNQHNLVDIKFENVILQEVMYTSNIFEYCSQSVNIDKSGLVIKKYSKV